jgi:hypothetical protein
MGRIVAALVLSVLVLGATDALAQSETVRIRVAPKSVTAGDKLFVTAAVRPVSATCTATLSRASSVLKLRARRTVIGVVNWAAKIPTTAKAGTWTARVACGKAGSTSARFTVKARTPPPPPTIPAKVVVVKSGVSSSTSFGFTEIGYGIVLQNVSPDEDALRVEVTINFLDNAGLIIRSTSDTYEAIPAGVTYYAGGRYSYSGSTRPARLEVIVQTGDHQKKSLGALPPTSNIRISDTSTSAHVLGEFQNPYTKTMSDIARITAVCFDGAGNVIGGGYTYPQASVTPGGRIGFDISIDGLHAAQIASAQVSVEPELTG